MVRYASFTQVATMSIMNFVEDDKRVEIENVYLRLLVVGGEWGFY